MKYFFIIALLVFTHTLFAQHTVKVGWNTYNASVITHQYTYRYTYKDSTILTLIDSMQIFCTSDSFVSVCVHTPMHDRSIYKTADFMNTKKQLIKTEEYKDESLLSSKEWSYDDKSRKIYQMEENKVNGNVYKKNYDYAAEKKSGDFIVTESAYYNGKIEFYTKTYYDRNSVKYKEVRLNDNNKDIVHIESYSYGDNGKVRERSVFFPEFKVTKKFEEKEGMVPAKCFRKLPMGVIEKPTFNTSKIPFIKKALIKNQAIIYDKDCDEFEYKFTNGSNCEIIVSTTKTPNVWQVVYRFKEAVK